MNSITCTLLACLALGLSTSQGTRLAEPPQTFVLQANGKELELRIGQPIELPKEFSAQKVTLRVRPTRQFDYEGLRFRYPQAYVWEMEEPESGERLVTLTGHTNVVFAQFFPGKQDPAAVLSSLSQRIADGFGPRTKITASEITGKDKRKLAGKRLEAKVARSTIIQEVYTFRLGEEVGALIVQDTLTDDGKSDPETEEMVRLLADSLEWPK